MGTFLQWLSAISFSGDGYDDLAIAEGLADALLVCTTTIHFTLLPFVCYTSIIVFHVTIHTLMLYLLNFDGHLLHTHVFLGLGLLK